MGLGQTLRAAAFALLAVSAAAAPPSISKPTYLVGALQHPSLPAETPSATLMRNVDTIATVLATNASNHDLVVAAEFALFGQFKYTYDAGCRARLQPYCYPVPAAGQDVDCTGFDAATTADPIRRVACSSSASRYENATVSLNVCEQVLQNATNKDAASTQQQFNSQVILRGRRIVTKYHKRHTVFVDCYDVPSLEIVSFPLQHNDVFTSSAMQKAVKSAAPVVGPAVGVFTCADMLFDHPKEDLVARGVRVFAYAAAYPMMNKAAVLWSLLSNSTVVAADFERGNSVVAVRGEVLASCPKSAGQCLASAHVALP